MYELVLRDGILTAYINSRMESDMRCKSLEEIEIPDSCVDIDENALIKCINLKKITVSEANDEYTAVDGVLFSKDLKRIIKYPPLKNGDLYEIPDSVEVIERCAFCNCLNLSHIKIPESVTSIREFAFANCNNLGNVFIHEKMEIIESNAFFGCLGLERFEMHPSCRARALITHVLFCCCNIEYIFLPDSNKRALPYMSSLKYYPGSKLGYGTKKRYEINKALKIVSRNLSIQKVPSSERDPYVRGFIAYSSEYPAKVAQEYLEHFRRTIKKWQPEIINNTRTLGFVLNNNVIKKTNADDLLNEIQKTGDAERIAMMMDYIQKNYGTGFDKFSERLEAKEKEEEKRINQKKSMEKRRAALEEKRKDPDADLKTVWTITKKSKTTCRLSNYKGNAETLVIPETYNGMTITEISKSYISGDNYDSVKRIVLPDTVEEISHNCFSNCKNLESIDLGKGLKRVGKSPFMGCKKLKEIVLPEGVNSTTKWMFRDCKSLEKVVFENRELIKYENDCNFLRGATKTKVYVHRGTALIDFKMDPERIVVIEDEQNTLG